MYRETFSSLVAGVGRLAARRARKEHARERRGRARPRLVASRQVPLLEALGARRQEGRDHREPHRPLGPQLLRPELARERHPRLDAHAQQRNGLALGPEHPILKPIECQLVVHAVVIVAVVAGGVGGHREVGPVFAPRHARDLVLVVFARSPPLAPARREKLGGALAPNAGRNGERVHRQPARARGGRRPVPRVRPGAERGQSVTFGQRTLARYRPAAGVAGVVRLGSGGCVPGCQKMHVPCLFQVYLEQTRNMQSQTMMPWRQGFMPWRRMFLVCSYCRCRIFTSRGGDRFPCGLRK